MQPRLMKRNLTLKWLIEMGRGVDDVVVGVRGE
jgi:hypothetical protein